MADQSPTDVEKVLESVMGSTAGASGGPNYTDLTTVGALGAKVLDTSTAAVDAQVARAELLGLDNAAEVSTLDKAAASLVVITATITGLFTGIGFGNGALVPMIRDFEPGGLLFLIFAAVAILVGTFATAINSYRSKTNLRLEQAALYAGIGFAGAAFVLASWGMALEASGATNRPTLSASFTSSSSGVQGLTVTVAMSDVPRSSVITSDLWGLAGGTWKPLDHVASGPAAGGSVSSTIVVGDDSPYSEIVVAASVGSVVPAMVAQPPGSCPLAVGATGGGARATAAGTSSTSTTSTTQPKPQSCLAIGVPPAPSTTTTTAAPK